MEKRRVFLVCSFIFNIISFVVVLLTSASLFIYGGDGIESKDLFRYFTFESNILVGITSAIYSVYAAIAFFKNKDLVLPKWLQITKLLATTMIALTAITVLVFLGPNNGFENLLRGYNLMFHVIVPMFTIVSFLGFEVSSELKWKYSFIPSAFVVIYGIIYLIEVDIAHNWPDFYQFNITKTWYFLLPIFVIGTFGISYGLSVLQRFITKFYSLEKYVSHSDLTAYEIYISKIYKATILVAAYAALFAGIFFTVGYAIGWFPNINKTFLIFLDISTVSYTILAYIIIYFSFNKNGTLKDGYLLLAKVLIAIIIVIQWNVINYMVDVDSFWAFTIFFALLTSFFFDHKYQSIIITELSLSLLISYIIKYDLFNIPNDGDFALQIICVSFSMVCIQLVTYFGKNVLVKQLENISDYDPLTMLYNRRLLNTRLESNIKKARDNKSEFCVLMMDLDDFKKINDTYGHEFGDKVLKNLANILSLTIDKDDLAFRYGGEEFLAIVNKNSEETINMCNDLLVKVAESKVYVDKNTPVSITITIGVAEFDYINFTQDLIALADARLYRGKQKGKNCVISADTIGK